MVGERSGKYGGWSCFHRATQDLILVAQLCDVSYRSTRAALTYRANCSKCQTILEWPTLSSFAVSGVVFVGSTSTVARSCPSSITDGHSRPPLSWRSRSPDWNFWNRCWTALILMISLPKTSIMFRVVCAVLEPSLHW